MKTINCKCGIYETEYQMTEHRDGSISVRKPYVRWANNSGSLDFDTVKIEAGKTACTIKGFFEKEILADDIGTTLPDLLSRIYG